MKRFLIACWLATVAFAASALPTVEQVQAEIGKGNYAQAEVLMRDVVVAKPGSARAHYVYAEILAHDRRFDMAAEELARARQIDPALKFAPPDKFNAFAQLLEREQAATRQRSSSAAGERAAPRAAPPAPATQFGERAAVDSGGGGMPRWIWGAGLLVIAVIAWRALAARRPASPVAGQPGATYGAAPVGFPGQQAVGPGAPGYGAGGYGPGYAPGGYGPARAGGGLLGTGMAVAGGVAAGMLAEKLFEGHRDSAAGADAAAAGAGGFTGGQFNDGFADNAAARELEQRPIDMGSGDEWGGDAGAGGGDMDTGSSGGDDGW